MPSSRDPRVDAYLDSLPDWQQDICREVRALVHAADPDVEEAIKRTNRPYFVLRGNICALLAAKDHVNVFLYDPIAPDPEGIVTAGHENKPLAPPRSVKETINARALRNVQKRSSPTTGRRLAQAQKRGLSHWSGRAGMARVGSALRPPRYSGGSSRNARFARKAGATSDSPRRRDAAAPERSQQSRYRLDALLLPRVGSQPMAASI
jgi:hypothetical protein